MNNARKEHVACELDERERIPGQNQRNIGCSQLSLKELHKMFEFLPDAKRSSPYDPHKYTTPFLRTANLKLHKKF